MEDKNKISPDYYSRWKIQPWDFICANNLDFMRGNIIKYVMRFDSKNGVEDLKKARNYLDRLIENCERLRNCETGLKKILQVSSAHISDEDEDFLLKFSSRIPQFITKKDSGFLILVGSPEVERGSALDILSQLPMGLSREFFALYKEAQMAGALYLDIDVDCDVLPGFPVFPW